MKKSIATLLLVCLLLPMLLFSFNTTEKVWDIMFPTQVAQASEIRSTPYSNSFLQHYFYNLQSNFGNNIAGTCGYVAVGMLLSYFDTYWDDNIVPEVYETNATISSLSDYHYNSPGAGESGHSTSTCGYSIDYSDLYSLFLHLGERHGDELFRGFPYVDDTLHGELIARRINFSSIEDGDLRSIDPMVAEFLANDFLSSYSPNSLYTSNTYNDLWGETNATILQEKSNTTRERIISHVRQNIPVAVYVGSTTDWNDRHVAIAYDYDVNNDMLYFHMGGLSAASRYVSEATHNVYPKASTNINASNIRYYYGDLTFFLLGDHVHSNNFVLDSGSAVCSCQLSDHTHMYSYSLFNESNHKKSCHCGYSTTEGHSYRYENLKYVCRYCNKIYSGGTPPITPALPVANNSGNSEWLGINVVNMEVPTYEE